LLFTTGHNSVDRTLIEHNIIRSVKNAACFPHKWFGANGQALFG
jgi:hypothetical protein